MTPSLCPTNRKTLPAAVTVRRRLYEPREARQSLPEGDPQICAILLENRRPEIGGYDSGYSRFSPKDDAHGWSLDAHFALESRHLIALELLARWQ
jgi:hypothetical protein